MSGGNQSPTTNGNGDPDGSTSGIGYAYPAWNLSSRGGRSGSVVPPNLHYAKADWYMSIGSGGSGSGNQRRLGNRYANLHESGGGRNSSGSGYPRSLGDGYADLHGINGGSGYNGSAEPYNLLYGHPNWSGIGGGGGSSSGSVDPPNLHYDQSDWYMSIGSGGGSSGNGDPRSLGNGYANLHGSGGGGESSSGSGDPRSLGNGYANLHESCGCGSSSGSGYRRSLGDGYANLHESGDSGSSSGSGYLRSLGDGYAHSHGINGGSGYSGSAEPYNLLYGHPNWPGIGGGGGSAVARRTPGHGYYAWYENVCGGPTVYPPSFTGMYAPHQATMEYHPYYSADAVPPFVPNGGQPRPPLQSGLQEVNVEDRISHQVGSLTIGSRRNINLERGRLALAEIRNRRQQEGRIARGISNSKLPAGAGRVNANPYRSMRLEDVRGSMSRVARELRGCQFLRRMVEERGAAAVRDVFYEVAGDVVRLMGDPVGAALVEDMARLWTDEQVARVLRSLDASPPREVMEAATNHAGANVLEKLIGRVHGHREQTESFTRCLAGVGGAGVLALIKDQAGSHVIQKCLETFSPEHNLFIAGVVADHPYDVSSDRHGCHTMKRCIDNASDAETSDLLVRAVCEDGLALAQDDFGNYVVQHVIGAVPEAPWAKDSLHADFRGWYVSLSRHKASSNVVQGCLAAFPRVYRVEIVCELLADPRFHELIHDPYANYVLHSAISTTGGPVRELLVDAIRPYRDILRHNMHSKRIMKMLFPPSKRPFF